jgi:hypothetical protein
MLVSSVSEPVAVYVSLLTRPANRQALLCLLEGVRAQPLCPAWRPATLSRPGAAAQAGV